jgi:hypothetical protein
MGIRRGAGMKYKINLARTEYYYQVVEVDTDTEEQAIDMAWDQSGKWLFADAEEFTNGIEETV